MNSIMFIVACVGTLVLGFDAERTLQARPRSRFALYRLITVRYLVLLMALFTMLAVSGTLLVLGACTIDVDQQVLSWVPAPLFFVSVMGAVFGALFFVPFFVMQAVRDELASASPFRLTLRDRQRRRFSYVKKARSLDFGS
jgi:hypothetical protein